METRLYIKIRFSEFTNLNKTTRVKVDLIARDTHENILGTMSTKSKNERHEMSTELRLSDGPHIEFLITVVCVAFYRSSTSDLLAK